MKLRRVGDPESSFDINRGAGLDSLEVRGGRAVVGALVGSKRLTKDTEVRTLVAR